MILLDVAQGSPEWIAARVGIPTASQFGRILTPKTMKLGAGAKTYMMELLAEWMIGAALDGEVTAFMERGTELEDKAVEFYEFQREVETTAVGFCLTDDGRCGASPDRLVGEDGGLEIKCPSATVHVSYLMGDMGKYNAQIQGGMWVTGRQWWDFLSYNPEMPPALVRVERDEEFIGKLADAMETFLDDLDAAKQKMRALGYVDDEPFSPARAVI